MSMIRTQIYLPRKLHERIKRLAKRRRASQAAIIRDALEQYEQSEHVNGGDGGASVIRDVANITFKGGPRDLSERIDDYLYGGENQADDSD